MRAFGPLRVRRRMRGLGKRDRAGRSGNSVCAGKSEGRVEAGPRHAAQPALLELMRSGRRGAVAPSRRLDRTESLGRYAPRQVRRRRAKKRRQDAQHGHWQECQEPRARK